MDQQFTSLSLNDAAHYSYQHDSSSRSPSTSKTSGLRWSLHINLKEDEMQDPEINDTNHIHVSSLTNDSNHSMSTSISGYAHTYTCSNGTTGTDNSCYMPPSPLNQEQEVRDKGRKWHYPNTSQYMDDVDINDIITQCPRNGASSDNPSNTNNGHHNDQNNDANGRINDNHCNDSASGRYNNNGDGDDEKKDNDKNKDEWTEDVVDPTDIVNKYTKYSYTPSARYRAQGFIKISRRLTQHIIPQVIKERIANVWDFMDKTTGVFLHNGNILNIRNVKILNYGFHDKYGNVLYLVAVKVKNRKGKYVMSEGVYTGHQICNEFRVTENVLPKSCVDMNGEQLANDLGILNDMFIKLNYRGVLSKCNKLPVFVAAHRKKEYNTQRMTFSMAKPAFIKMVADKRNKSKLIPIIMFNHKGYRMEYVQIIRIRSNVDIGISYIYDYCKNSVKATGIHLDKMSILYQHQLIAPNHDCHCLDYFYSDIDALHIGNPDDDKNRVKNLQKQNLILDEKMESMNQKNHTLKVENDILKIQNKVLMQRNMVPASTPSTPLIALSAPLMAPISMCSAQVMPPIHLSQRSTPSTGNSSTSQSSFSMINYSPVPLPPVTPSRSPAHFTPQSPSNNIVSFPSKTRIQYPSRSFPGATSSNTNVSQNNYWNRATRKSNRNRRSQTK